MRWIARHLRSIGILASPALVVATFGCGGASPQDDQNNNNNANLTVTVCGDGVRTGLEECDDGAANSDTAADACRTNCRLAHCGDGTRDTGEQCDDGNTTAGDDCGPTCRYELCGNGILDPGENCDDGNQDTGDGCSADCRSDETCGNGFLDLLVFEVCDDGNNTSGDGCSADCLSDETCGNGILDPAAGEQCDDTNDATGDGCSATCQLERCGNGILDPHEACDDGNQESGDGCSADCLSDETCGNGFADGAIGETCDDGNLVAGDGCGPTCQIEFCGNGILDPGEQCDDGNVSGGDSCTPACLLGDCGNGVLDAAEACDDGNRRSHDGCSSGCSIETRKWVEVFPANGPSRRQRHMMAYDGRRRRTVLFGGWCGFGCLASDVWEYDGTDWFQIALAGGPQASLDISFVYFALREVTVLSGTNPTSGNTSQWHYDGQTWTPVAAAGATTWWGMASAYDIRRRRLFVFGGTVNSSLENSFAWSGDGSTWTWLSTATRPSPRRARGQMVHDIARDRLVLWGGQTATGANDETWEYDIGADLWTEVFPTNRPDPGEGAWMIYDPVQSLSILFKGDQTWTWDGTDWSRLDLLTAPSFRDGHTMVYDSARDRIVLFGGVGVSVLDDTWEFRWESDWPDEVCTSGLDDDRDGLIDCADPDCAGRPCATGTCAAGICQ